MLDNVVGRPNFAWRRRETYAVLAFSLWILAAGRRRGPRLLWIRNLNRALQRFQPWQLIGATLTLMYAARHTDKLLGLNAPDYLPGYLYAREFNRATWIVTGLDAGFATAASIKSKWLRDIASIVFSLYYFLHHDEADNKLARFREVCTLDMLRITWDKMNNPYLRLISLPFRPSLSIRRQITLNRPVSSTYTRPIIGYLFFSGTEAELAASTELILDFPGGGFVAMGPTHHEERLRQWAKRTRKPVFSIDYGKAPEYPYPYAIDEGFDTYITLVNSKGRVVGMSGNKIKMVLSGDSAGGNIAVNVMLKIVESALAKPPIIIPRPVGLAITYGSLNFSFSAWAWPSGPPYANSYVESASHDDFVPHIGPLGDPTKANIGATRFSGSDMNSTVHQHANIGLFARHQHNSRAKQQTAMAMQAKEEGMAAAVDSLDDGWSKIKLRRRSNSFSHLNERPVINGGDNDDMNKSGLTSDAAIGALNLSSASSFSVDGSLLSLDPKMARRRSRSNSFGALQSKYNAAQLKRSPIDDKMQVAQMAADPRLTIASKTGYLHDRIISPSMMWTMCLLYIGSNYRPGVENDYHLSPILAPAHLLAEFPPLFLQCGGRDPLVDDTVIFGGRVRGAKSEKKEKKRQAEAAKLSRKASIAGMKKYSMKWDSEGKGSWIGGQKLPEVKGYSVGAPFGQPRNNSMIPPLSKIEPGRESQFPDRISVSKSAPTSAGVHAGPLSASPDNFLDNDEDDITDTSEEEVVANSNQGVTMQIFPGWSHGYLQMSTIMPEAHAAIDDIADWIVSAFDRHRLVVGEKEKEFTRLKRTNSFYC